MRKYEMTYLVSDEVQESDLNKITGQVNGYVTELGGKIIKEDIWGRRKLAYPIKKQDFATYITLYYSISADKAIVLDREIRLMPEVVRTLTQVTDFGDEELTLTADEVVATEEIEKAVGGEESFEAIEGETEESRDLMAKRKEEEEEAKKEVAKEEKVEEKKEETVEEEVTTETPKKESKEEKPKTEKKEKKTAKPKKSDEAERLSKLNEELDDILKDEL